MSASLRYKILLWVVWGADCASAGMAVYGLSDSA